MAHWEDRERERFRRGNYAQGDRYRGREDRDWTDRTADEARSWFGDDEAEQRRRWDERYDERFGRNEYDGGRAYGEHEYPGRGSYPGGYSSGGYGRSISGAAGAAGYGAARSRFGGGYGNFGGGYAGYGSRPGSASYGEDYGARGSFGRSQYGRSGDYGARGGYGGEERGFFERAGDEIASWFGDEEAERRRRMDRHVGRGPKGYTRSDDRIREDVNDRLTDDPHIDASDIEVSVSGGEVTLSGSVTERFAKRHAEDIAERVSGVKHVQNNIRVNERLAASGETYSGAFADAARMTAESGKTNTGRSRN